MSKFTSGKWEAGQVIGRNEWLIFTNRDTPKEHIAADIQGCYKVVAPMQIEVLPEETAANARLIVSAPEMYELLKVWVNVQAQPTLRIAQRKAQELLAYIDGEEAEE